MPRLAFALLATGFGIALFHNAFLLISYLSRQRGRNVSPVTLPFIGPLCVVAAVCYGARPIWLGLLVLLLDGVNPLVVRALWDTGKTSRLTRIALLRGRKDDRKVRLTLHRKNKFVLVSEWSGPRGRLYSSISQTGEYAPLGTGYVLTVTPKRTVLVERDGEGFKVVDPSGDLHGWRLRR